MDTLWRNKNKAIEETQTSWALVKGYANGAKKVNDTVRAIKIDTWKQTVEFVDIRVKRKSASDSEICYCVCIEDTNNTHGCTLCFATDVEIDGNPRKILTGFESGMFDDTDDALVKSWYSKFFGSLRKGCTIEGIGSIHADVVFILASYMTPDEVNGYMYRSYIQFYDDMPSYDLEWIKKHVTWDLNEISIYHPDLTRDDGNILSWTVQQSFESFGEYMDACCDVPFFIERIRECKMMYESNSMNYS